MSKQYRVNRMNAGVVCEVPIMEDVATLLA